MPKAQRRSRKKLVFMTLAIAGALIAAWVLYDLYAPRTAHLREFDPDEVARLETAMWRSYYQKQRVQLFNQLSELLRTQYNMPLVGQTRWPITLPTLLSFSSKESSAPTTKRRCLN